jgi:hypothetical protein
MIKLGKVSEETKGVKVIIESEPDGALIYPL